MIEKTDNAGFFSSLRFRYGLGLLVFLSIAGYFLWAEHQAHIMGFAPLVLLLGACLGMHFFMHGGHGGGHGPDDESGKGGK
jgi:Protein of unknown function (DUF2933)